MASELTLHLIPDDKFSNDFIRVCNEIAPGEQEYVCVCPDEVPKFIKPDLPQLQLVSSVSEAVKVISAKPFSRLIIHALYGRNLEVVRRLEKRNQKFVWIFYGADGYRYSTKSQFEPKTRLLHILHYGNSSNALVSVARYIKAQLFPPNLRADAQVLKKVDYFAFWLRKDFEMLLEAGVLNRDVQFLPFFYGSFLNQEIPFLFRDGKPERILLGNSANLTNNHPDAIALLSSRTRNLQVFCPLSYSGPDWYKQEVITRGKKAFGDEFIPYVNFMQKQEYSDLLATVDAGVFNHIRQQGVGNVNYLISSGKRIYLNKKTPILDFYRSLGCKIFTLEDFGVADDFTLEDAKRNLQALSNFFNKENRDALLTNLLKC